jgi:hypothetical protein
MMLGGIERVKGDGMQARSCQDARYFSSLFEDIKTARLFNSKQPRAVPESIVLVSVGRDCVFVCVGNVRRFI